MYSGQPLLTKFWFLTNDPASSAGFREFAGSSSSAASSMETLNSHPSQRKMWDTCRSPGWCGSIARGAIDSTGHNWRAWTSATILSYITTWMSLGPWSLVGDGGRKSPHLNLARLGEALHQPPFSFWAAGSLKAAACFLYLGVTEGPCALLAKGPEIPPPIWQLFSFLYVHLDPVIGAVWIGGWQTLESRPVPGSPGVLGLVTRGIWGHGWRGRWT